MDFPEIKQHADLINAASIALAKVAATKTAITIECDCKDHVEKWTKEHEECIMLYRQAIAKLLLHHTDLL